MVMDFTIDASVDMSTLSSGQQIDFEMEKTPQGQYVVTEIKQAENAMPSEVWVDGEITMLMADFGMITIQHSAVPDWQWEQGEMNFSTDDNIDLSSFSEGDSARFLIKKQGSDFVLSELKHGEIQP